LKYSTYSVISPEGCASILWKSAEKAPQAAEAMAITSSKLLALGLIDGVIEEPLGGAHRNLSFMKAQIKQTLLTEVETLTAKSVDDLLAQRYKRLMSYGRFTEA
jgi:acetyl-CoA carboxylase carboxyl transferase subunit alpha